VSCATSSSTSTSVAADAMPVSSDIDVRVSEDTESVDMRATVFPNRLRMLGLGVFRSLGARKIGDGKPEGGGDVFWGRREPGGKNDSSDTGIWRVTGILDELGDDSLDVDAM
jgi:hypothetical protein